MNDTALYDTLNHCAVAVDEATSGSPVAATIAWMEADVAAGRAFRPGTEAAQALAAIVRVSAPSYAGEPGRAELWRALAAASAACLVVSGGNQELADDLLLDASGLAALTTCPQAFAVILPAIFDASRSGVTA